jgi:hypothetical protein
VNTSYAKDLRESKRKIERITIVFNTNLFFIILVEFFGCLFVFFSKNSKIFHRYILKVMKYVTVESNVPTYEQDILRCS